MSGKVSRKDNVSRKKRPHDAESFNLDFGLDRPIEYDQVFAIGKDVGLLC